MSGRWKPGEPRLGEPGRLTSRDTGDAIGSREPLAFAAAGSDGDGSGAPASSGAASGVVTQKSRDDVVELGNEEPAAEARRGPPIVPRPSPPRPGVPRPAPHVPDTAGSPRPAPAPAASAPAKTRDTQPSSTRLTSEIPQHNAPVHLSGNAPSFLDKLFATLVGLASDGPLDEAVSALLDPFTEVFDEVAVGACIARGNGEQLTVRKSTRPAGPPVPDPARLFPEFDHEWVVDLGAGSTLHLATDDEPSIALVQEPSGRLAMALRSVLERSHAFEALHAEQRETEQLRLQVIHSEKLASLGQIAAGIVHELNNPLTSILAYSDYLRRDWEKRGMASADTERLRRINEAAERILTFTRDLIAYSRPTASVPGPVDLHEVLERALVFCEHVISTHQVTVDRTFGHVRLVSGVAGQLTQVFVNLFTNACQAMHEGGGHLAITTELSDDETRVFVTVADQGHGIREEHMPRLFEPYFTTKVDGAGTGLGLPIVQNIVKNHGGCISAKNQDRGAMFIIELPVSARVTLFDQDG